MEWLVTLAIIKLFNDIILKIGASCIYHRFLDSSKNHLSWSISYLKHNSFAGNNLTIGAILCCLLVLQGYAPLKHRAFLSSHFSCENPKSIVILRSANNTPKRNPFGQNLSTSHNPKSTSSSFIPLPSQPFIKNLILSKSKFAKQASSISFSTTTITFSH